MLEKSCGTLKTRWRAILAAVALALVLAGSWYYKLPALAWYWGGAAWNADKWRTRSLWLPGYRVTIEARPIEGISRNASGLTYHDQTDTLFVAINKPPQIAELTTEGRLLRLIPVDHITDLEGVTHIRDDEFALIDERNQHIYWTKITPETRRIDAAQAPRLGLGIWLNGNLGFEGVSWNNNVGRLFVGKEKSPIRIFSVGGLEPPDAHGEPLNLQILEWRPKQPPARFMRDLSSLSLHDRTGHMLLLSDESRLLAEYGKAGELISLMPLWRGWHGLTRSIPQAEGVTVDHRGTLYIVSEPNLFYRFERQGQDVSLAFRDS